MINQTHPFYTVQLPSGWYLTESNGKTSNILQAWRTTLEKATFVAKSIEGASVYHFRGV
jgi:hypothetical protein